MRFLISTLRRVSVIVLLVAASAVHADSRVDQVWTCTLHEGHTVAEMAAAQAKWVAWANKQPHGAKIRGYVGSPMVSSDLGVVIYIDSYPDLEAFAADAKAYDSAEGRALQARFDEISTCTSAALYSIQDVSSD